MVDLFSPWCDLDTKRIMPFLELVQRLQTLTVSLAKNKFGPVKVRVFGIDTALR